jgi:hypothetical protein
LEVSGQLYAPAALLSGKYPSVPIVQEAVSYLNRSRPYGECLHKVKESKAIPVTVRRGLQCCQMLRITHFLDNGFKDGSEVVGLTRQPRSFLILVLISVRG